jgi:hypothetical protein
VKQVSISQVDALFANGAYPIEFLFAFKGPLSARRLRRALRALAPLFWPAFGEYREGVIVFDRYREEEVFDERSVGRKLDAAELETAPFETLAEFGRKDPERLFFLTATRFTDGLVIVPAMSHLAGDGYSYFFFLSALAALTRAVFLPIRGPFLKAIYKPHHRRTALGGVALQGKVRRPAPAVPPARPAVESLEVPKADIQALVREASASGLRLSSNDILSAMVVKRLAEVRGRTAEAVSRLTIPIDVRGRVPELGRKFFGNGIMLHTMDLDGPPGGADVKDLAARVRGAMPRVSRDVYRTYLAGLERMIAEERWEEFRPFDPDKGCLITNLSKLPSDKLDLGAGPPEAVVPLTVERNSAAILARGDNYVLRIGYGSGQGPGREESL